MRKIAFIFPGQGSQYRGMWENNCNSNKIVNNVFEEASDSIGIDLKKFCFETEIDELMQTKNAQPAIFTVSYAAFKMIMEEGLCPSLMAGHSLGEITALTCAGAISFADAIKIVKARGEIMHKVSQKSSGIMAAVRGGNVENIRLLCDKYSRNGQIVNMSNYNSDTQIVISGNKEAVIAVGEELESNGGKYTQLKVSAPFHCPLMNDAVDEFREVLKSYNYHQFEYPVISNVSAELYKDPNEIIDTLSNHLVKQVLWKNIMDYFEESKIDTIIELGPKNILTKLIRKAKENINSFAYDNLEDSIKIKEIIGECTGKTELIRKKQDELNTVIDESINKFIKISKEEGNINPNETAITMCLANAVSIPNKTYNIDKYQKMVIEPYKKVRRIQAVIEREERNPSVLEIKNAFDMLFSVFEAKETSIEEQEYRIKNICNKMNR